MEILPTHCGAGSAKVNYCRCMRKNMRLGRTTCSTILAYLFQHRLQDEKKHTRK